MMDQDKSKQQLIDELEDLRRRVAELKAHDQGGEVNGILGVNLDITEPREAEESLRQKVEELAALNTLAWTTNATLALEEATKAALAGMLHAVRPDLAFLFLRNGERLILKDVLPLTSPASWRHSRTSRGRMCLWPGGAGKETAVFP